MSLSHKPTIKKVRDKCLQQLERSTQWSESNPPMVNDIFIHDDEGWVVSAVDDTQFWAESNTCTGSMRATTQTFYGKIAMRTHPMPLPEKWEGEAVVGSNLTGDYPTIRLPDECNHLVGKKVVISLEVAE